jgi:hypothetical protein
MAYLQYFTLFVRELSLEQFQTVRRSFRESNPLAFGREYAYYCSRSADTY